MRVVVLTSMRYGSASEFLPALAANPNIEIAMVVLSHNVPRSKWKVYRKKARKLWRIGPLGGLVGLHMRKWNEGYDAPDLYDVTKELGLRLEEVPRLNCERTRELVREADAELGLALGCTLIARSVFSIPKRGMINVHGDVLPRFRGGSSVIWPIYENHPEAGFTIHEIDRGIDTGRILYVERFPIDFKQSLRETYRSNILEIRRRVPGALVNVVANFSEFEAGIEVQGEGTTYTTPSLGQFLRMRRNHRELRRAPAQQPPRK